MMYINRPRGASIDYDDTSYTADTVYVPEAEPEWTWSGLYDQHGNKLGRKAEKVRIGFHVR